MKSHTNAQSKSFRSGLRKPLSGALLAAGLMAASAGANAVPIGPDLTVTSSVELSTSIGISPFSDGNVTQAGDIRVTEGGALTSAAFTTAPGMADGADDGTTVLPGTNPLTGTLTDTGDGTGWSTDLDALFATGFNFNEGYDFIVDSSIDLANGSILDTYKVTVKVNYSNVVDAGGLDAYAVAGLDVELDNVDVLLSDVESDIFFGDKLNGISTGTFGSTIADIGMFTFDVLLAPGAMHQVTAVHQWEGGVFDNPGNSNVDVAVDITIDAVMCTAGPCGQPPQVPEPGAIALLALGLPGLALARRLRRQRAAKA